MTKILVFSGSSRAGSVNHMLAELAARKINAAGASATLISLADFPLPLVDATLQAGVCARACGWRASPSAR